MINSHEKTTSHGNVLAGVNMRLRLLVFTLLLLQGNGIIDNLILVESTHLFFIKKFFYRLSSNVDEVRPKWKRVQVDLVTCQSAPGLAQTIFPRIRDRVQTII